MHAKHEDDEIAAIEDLLERFTKLKRAGLKGGGKAPHKYLLLLFAISQCLKGEERMMPYQTVTKGLTPLLERYAPYTKHLRPNLPFWHLQNDGIWELDDPSLVRKGVTKKPSISDLAQRCGGLSRNDYDLFSQNHSIALIVVHRILNLLYPASLHDQILETAGINDESNIKEYKKRKNIEKLIWHQRRWRDPKFPKQVIKAYDKQCAVCRFSIRLNDKPVGLEAAHIRWHQHNGPEYVSNGLALCAMHHELFDAGAFTVAPDVYKVHVSNQFSGHGDDEMLGRFDEQPLARLPREKSEYPSQEHLLWHIDNIYRGPRTNLL